MTKLYSVTELAEELQVTPRALRFYEDKGLIAPQRGIDHKNAATKKSFRQRLAVLMFTFAVALGAAKITVFVFLQPLAS